MRFPNLIISIILVISFTSCDDINTLAPQCEGLACSLVDNWSFEEGRHDTSRTPQGWIDCGDFPDLYSSIDVFRSDVINRFQVDHIAAHGNQYAGMVVRPDGSRECILQQFIEPLAAGNFTFEIGIGTTDNYIGSVTLDDGTSDKVNFGNPVILEIITIDQNNVEEIVWTVENTTSEWVVLTKEIQINKEIIGIKLSPNFKELPHYRGSVLIDYFSILED